MSELVKDTSTLPAYACAKFNKPCTRHKQLAAIPTKNVKNFCGSEVDDKKMVRVVCGDSFCTAILILTGETLESVKADMSASNNKRIRIPNQRILDSPSGTESEIEVPKGKKVTSEKLKSKSILEKKLSEVKKEDPTAKTTLLSNNAHSMQKEGTSEKLKEGNEDLLQNARNELKKLTAHLKESKHEIENLKFKLDSEISQKNELFQLNVELQRKVIGVFTDVNTNLTDMKKNLTSVANMNGRESGEKVGFIEGDEIHLGRNVRIKKVIYDCIRSKSKITPALFVKEMAVAVFGTDKLIKSTVTGTGSNRKKKNGENENVDDFEKLDPIKMLAITDITYFWMLNEKKSDKILAENERSKVATYISHKISELKRRHFKNLEIIAASERVVAALPSYAPQSIQSNDNESTEAKGDNVEGEEMSEVEAREFEESEKENVEHGCENLEFVGIGENLESDGSIRNISISSASSVDIEKNDDGDLSLSVHTPAKEE